MRVRQVQLKNISCFGAHTFDFTDPETGNVCDWVVILGENGTGKSTLLRMLGLALLGRDMIHNVASTGWQRYVRAGCPKGQVVAKFEGSTRETRGRESPIVEATFDLRLGSGYGLKQDVEAAEEDARFLWDRLHNEAFGIGWFACGYGAFRRVPAETSDSRAQSLTTTGSKPYRFATLYNEYTPLTRVSDWMMDLELRRLKGPDAELAKVRLAHARRALETAMPNTRFKEITADGVIFTENGVDLPLHQLSDGYRSVGGLVGDLVRRLTDAFPKIKDPLRTEGVVLIDEIDIHLHPRWQGSVVETLRELFPKMQFIVTSHSPFVAQDMRPKDKIIILHKDAGGVTVSDKRGYVSGWRADQILTSVFGLDGTRNRDVRERGRELHELTETASADDARLTAAERRRLTRAREWLAENRSAPGETLDAREVYELADLFSQILARFSASKP